MTRTISTKPEWFMARRNTGGVWVAWGETHRIVEAMVSGDGVRIPLPDGSQTTVRIAHVGKPFEWAGELYSYGYPAVPVVPVKKRKPPQFRGRS